MISFIQHKNYNILINTKTGQWLGFKMKVSLPQSQIDNISKEDFLSIFKKYKDQTALINGYDKVKEALPFKNDLLTSLNYLVLHTSDMCNMSCKYCYAYDNVTPCESKIMSSKTMIDAVNMFRNPEQEFYVLLHGREPLTNYDNIILLLKHFANEKNIHFILQSNGMLLSDDKISELEKLGVNICVSLDGIDDKSNLLRINGACNGYTKKLKDLIKKHKEISALTIIHKNNVKSVLKTAKFLNKHGHDNLTFNFLWPTANAHELNKYVVDNASLYKTMKKLFKASIDSKSGEFKFKERDLYLLYGRIANRHINNYMCNRAPCGAGKVCICVDDLGDVYPCTTVNGQKDNYMGNIYNNKKDEILEHDYALKHRSLSDIEGCKNCPYSIFCGGGACSGLLFNYKNQINLPSIYCNYYKNVILYIMKVCINASKNKFFIFN